MYLDTDIILALVKKNDWLKPYVNFNKIPSPLISTVTLIELELVINRELGKEEIPGFFKKIKELKVKISPVDENVVQKSAELIGKYDMTIFDSIHAAFCIINNERILSSDTIFDHVKEISRIDPKEL